MAWRDQFLPGPRLAGDEHGGVGRREAADRLEDLAHLRVLADDALEAVAVRQLVAESAISSSRRRWARTLSRTRQNSSIRNGLVR